MVLEQINKVLLIAHNWQFTARDNSLTLIYPREPFNTESRHDLRTPGLRDKTDDDATQSH